MTTKKSKEEVVLEEVIALTNKDVNLIDALIHYANENDMEVELVGEIVRRSVILKAMVAEDAEKLNLIEKRAKLPI